MSTTAAGTGARVSSTTRPVIRASCAQPRAETAESRAATATHWVKRSESLRRILQPPEVARKGVETARERWTRGFPVVPDGARRIAGTAVRSPGARHSAIGRGSRTQHRQPPWPTRKVFARRPGVDGEAQRFDQCGPSGSCRKSRMKPASRRLPTRPPIVEPQDPRGWACASPHGFFDVFLNVMPGPADILCAVRRARATLTPHHRQARNNRGSHRILQATSSLPLFFSPSSDACSGRTSKLRPLEAMWVSPRRQMSKRTPFEEAPCRDVWQDCA